MPYFAAVFAQTDSGWIAAEADLGQAEQPEDVTDLMREAAVEAAADTPGEIVVLLVEENDTWFGVVRVDGEDDPRIFLSDAAAAQASGLGGLIAELVADGLEPKADGDPAGDPAVLTDLGTDADRLLGLAERAVPTDALADLAEHAGFAEELDALRA
ncbi:hypothetical protein LO762_29235 [Actinocorallia sp. API 0066]|uniref:tRNA adenosine deaminase-associated protein n=1 Tax=Actinocorallia sp. API 0066 TaxID=2896846 RepID=UPI001E3F80BD|nr:hypothetical protein [Actinocorallia sp. API 0066]MCD0453235.1 hypothetical protein [Actinocorallia sp. API 0066]